jgi:hypothetical protein
MSLNGVLELKIHAQNGILVAHMDMTARFASCSCRLGKLIERKKSVKGK